MVDSGHSSRGQEDWDEKPGEVLGSVFTTGRRQGPPLAWGGFGQCIYHGAKAGPALGLAFLGVGS